MSTDMAAPVVEYHGPGAQRDPQHMSDRELLEETVRNQRVLIEQFGSIVSMFGDVHEKVAEGGIGGLMKALMGR
jgi:hypothetical protein